MNARSVPWAEIDLSWLLPKRYLSDVQGSTVPLASLVEIASGGYVDGYRSAGESGARPYLRVDNVRAFVPNVTDGDVVFVDSASVPGLDRVSVKAGDIVIARTGTLGKAFLVDASLDGAVLSQHLTRLRVKASKEGKRIDPLVLTAYLNSPRGQDRLHSLAGGSTRLELTHEQLGLVEVPTPLLSLTAARDGLLGSALERQQLLREAIERVVRLFGPPPPLGATGGAGPRTFATRLVHAHDSWLPRYHDKDLVQHELRLAAEFECRSLGDVADVFRGAGTHSAEYEREGLPFIKPSSLINGGIELFPEDYGSEESYQRHAQAVGTGDVLISIEGKIGLVALLGPKERVLVKNHIEVARLRPLAPISAELLYAFLASAHGAAQFARRVTVQATIPGIGSSSRSILIPIRPKSGGPIGDEVAIIEGFVKRATQIHARLRAQLANLLVQVQEVAQ